MVNAKNITKISLLFAVLIFFSLMASAESVTVYYFYSDGCGFCHQMNGFWEEMTDKYEELNLVRLDSQQNNVLFQKAAQLYTGAGVRGVPAYIVDGQMSYGYSAQIGASIEQEIQRCIAEGCQNPADVLEGEEEVVVSQPITGKAVQEKSSMNIANIAMFLTILIVVIVFVVIIINTKEDEEEEEE